MGRQTGFYFGAQDERQFLSLPVLAQVVFLRSDNYHDCQPRQYAYVEMTPFEKALHLQTLLCFKPEVSRMRFLPIADGKGYFIDDVCSPVIEYSRSGLSSETGVIVSGRIWYEHKYWETDEDGNDVLLEKPEELLRLYNSLARWIRKYCTRLPNGMYIGPHAMELYKKGAKLSP